MSYLDDPRVFFAAERTLLAWQRTAIAVIGLGILTGVKSAPAPSEACASNPPAVDAMPHDASSLWLTVLFLLAGAGAAVLANFQYLRFLRELSAPEIPRNHLTWPAPALNFLLAASALLMAWWFAFAG